MSDTYQESSDDFYLSLSYQALRILVDSTDRTNPLNKRALIAMLEIVKIDEWKDIQKYPMICDIVLECLKIHSRNDFVDFHYSRKLELQLMIKALDEWRI